MSFIKTGQGIYVNQIPINAPGIFDLRAKRSFFLQSSWKRASVLLSLKGLHSSFISFTLPLSFRTWLGFPFLFTKYPPHSISDVLKPALFVEGAISISLEFGAISRVLALDCWIWLLFRVLRLREKSKEVFEVICSNRVRFRRNSVEKGAWSWRLWWKPRDLMTLKIRLL